MGADAGSWYPVRMLTATPGWFVDAKCRGLDPNLFFPAKGEPTGPAKKVCWGDDGAGACPVRVDCLEWALRNREMFGVFGGMSERERRKVRRGRGRPVLPVRHGSTVGEYRKCLAENGGVGCVPCRAVFARYRVGVNRGIA